MTGETIAAIVGAVGSIIAAWITSRNKDESNGAGSVRIIYFLIVLALGLSITAIFIGAFTFNVANTPQFKVEQVTIAAEAGKVSSREFAHFEPPRVPDPIQSYAVPIACPDGYYPLSAWHELVGSHPTSDVMYTVNATVIDQTVYMYLRARQNADGYSYIQVIVLCTNTT